MRSVHEFRSHRKVLPGLQFPPFSFSQLGEQIAVSAKIRSDSSRRAGEIWRIVL